MFNKMTEFNFTSQCGDAYRFGWGKMILEDKLAEEESFSCMPPIKSLIRDIYFYSKFQ